MRGGVLFVKLQLQLLARGFAVRIWDWVRFSFFVFGAELLPACMRERHILCCTASIVSLASKRRVPNEVSGLAIHCGNSLERRAKSV